MNNNVENILSCGPIKLAGAEKPFFLQSHREMFDQVVTKESCIARCAV
jgi:hypothetical protein